MARRRGSSAEPSDRTTRKRRTAAQRLLLGVNILLVIACLAAAAGLAKVRSTLQQVPVVDIGSSQAPKPSISEPRNFLIIGTDSAARLDDSDPVTKGRGTLGRLADVIMILRIDPSDGSARLLSIPRDTRLELAPDGRMERINAAIAGSNGPRNLIQTIKRNFGVSIDNYVQIDFLAFKQLVEVLGGVPVYFTTPVRDANTGLKVTSTGCVLLDRDQALAYARARHFQFFEDGKWRSDGTGDLGRITRQQDFIKRALRRASDKGIRNPGTAVGLVNAGAKAVVLDSRLDVGTLLDLVGQFRNFNPDSLQTDQVPTRSAPRGGVAYQDVVWEKTWPLLLPFQGVVLGQRPKPTDIIVDVRGDNPEAAVTAIGLDNSGFDAERFEARSRPAQTTILYGPDGRDAALTLATYLKVTPKLQRDPEIVGYRVVLNLGADYDGLRDRPVAYDDLPPDLAPLESTTTTTTEYTSSSSTTVPGSTGSSVPDGSDANRPAPPGVVPTDAKQAAACR
ncbi:MAG: LCP family protein [Actinomycetes bacterium]